MIHDIDPYKYRICNILISSAILNFSTGLFQRAINTLRLNPRKDRELA